MKDNTTPASYNRSKEIHLKYKFKEQIKIYIDNLSSLDEMTFDIGVIINKMRSVGITNDGIVEELMSHDKFKNHKKSSMRELARVWGKGVHLLIKDFGHNGAEYKDVRKTLLDTHSVELTSHIIRTYSVDMNLCLQNSSVQAEVLPELYSNLDKEGVIESMSAMVENINDHNQEKREETSQVVITKVAKRAEGVYRKEQEIVDAEVVEDLRYEKAVSQFVNIKTIPVVKMKLYHRFMKALSCCNCEEKRAEDVLSLDVGYLPMSEGVGDLTSVPMCTLCKTEHESGAISFTQSEKSMMLIKYPAMFMQALIIDTENKLS